MHAESIDKVIPVVTVDRRTRRERKRGYFNAIGGLRVGKRLPVEGAQEARFSRATVANKEELEQRPPHASGRVKTANESVAGGEELRRIVNILIYEEKLEHGIIEATENEPSVSMTINDELTFSASAMCSAPESPMLLATMTMGRCDGDEHPREREWADEGGCG